MTVIDEGWIHSLFCSGEEAEARTRHIHDQILTGNPGIHDRFFDTISSDVLPRLFGLYDERFFGGRLGRFLAEPRVRGFSIGFSNRLTRAGGCTKCRKARWVRGGPPDLSLSLAVSAPLLFQTFRDVNRPVFVNGLVCHDRIEAMQRILEHEIVHLLEYLLWGQSSCNRPRFKRLARNIFNHTETTHRLVTQDERALKVYGLKAGDRVSFEFHGQLIVGTINRVAKRATILVESAKGLPYSDGNKYMKYYVPLDCLRRTSKSLDEA